MWNTWVMPNMLEYVALLSISRSAPNTNTADVRSVAFQGVFLVENPTPRLRPAPEVKRFHIQVKVDVRLKVNRRAIADR